MDTDREPPNLDEPEKMDGYWTEDTTITVSRYTKWSLDQDRDGQAWDPYLESLRRYKVDPLTLNDIEEISESLKNELSMANEPGVEIDVEDMIDRVKSLEDSVKETTNAIQRLEQQVEQLP